MTVDRTLVDKTGSLRDGGSIEIRYPVVVQNYAQLPVSLKGRQILVSASLTRCHLPMARFEMLTVSSHAT